MNAKRGQPPKGERALRDGIKVRLTGRDRARLNRLAERSGVGPATKARQYVVEAMEREEEEMEQEGKGESDSGAVGE